MRYLCPPSRRSLLRRRFNPPEPSQTTSMLTALRESTKGWVTTLILLLLALPFALYGIGDYFGMTGSRNVATVGDLVVTESEYRDALERDRRMMQQMLGENFDSALFDTPERKREVVEQVIDRKLRELQAQTAGVAIDAERIASEIEKMEAFQVDGKFSVAKYRDILARNQLTPKGFEALVASDLKVQELGQALGQSSFATRVQAQQALMLREDRRDFRFLRLALADAGDVPAPSDEELRAYHEQKKSEYLTEEQVDLEYIEIKAADLEVPPPTEEVLRARYREAEGRYVQPEQRLASHILLELPAGGNAEAQKAVRDKAAALVERVRKGEDFAALAKEFSQDIGSAAQGGDLGWLEQGQTEAAFDTALFAMQAGSVSDPVFTAQGVHVIQLREIKPESRKTFEEARAEIEAEYNNTERERLFNERAGRLVDATNQDPLSLATALRELGTESKRSGWISRSGGGEGLAGNREVLKQAFSDAVKVRGQNSGLITLERGHAVVLRVAEQRAPQQKAFEEVAEALRQRWTEERQIEALKARVDALWARVEAGESLETLARELGKTFEIGQGVTRGSGFPVQILEFVFRNRLGENGTPRPFKLELGSPREFAIGEMTAVTPADPTTFADEQIKAIRVEIAGSRSFAEARAMLKALRQAQEIEIREDRL
jgi:peptidyl-prolyl cis-trans isomerase D